jgi:hypothetical protein
MTPPHPYTHTSPWMEALFKKSHQYTEFLLKSRLNIEVWKCLKVETVSTFSQLKVETVSTFCKLKVETLELYFAP